MIAGIADVNRPAHKLSVRQSGALAATGVIWSRYSLVITPKNWNLFSVNVFVACTGLYQLARIWRSVEDGDLCVFKKPGLLSSILHSPTVGTECTLYLTYYWKEGLHVE